MFNGYREFLLQNKSVLAKTSEACSNFNEYRFSSNIGDGSTYIYKAGSYAAICIANHTYKTDFEYKIQAEDSIVIQQYDSIESDYRYTITARLL